MDSKRPLIAIVGPTASGKSSLAMKLAHKFGGEIICADSRTIYRCMDIGTAKPSVEDRRKVIHHCLDLVEPNERYSVAQFQAEAKYTIAEIYSRDKVPFLVGGSGLYVDSVLFDYDFGHQNETVELESLSLAELQDLAKDQNLDPGPQTLHNKRHLASYIKRGGKSSKQPIDPNILVIGIRVEKEALNLRIEQRVDQMLANGVVAETNSLLEKWGENAPGFITPGYAPIIEYLHRKISLEEAKLMFIRSHKLLAKRQMTWFKRNKDIQWVANEIEAEQLIQEKLRRFDTM